MTTDLVGDAHAGGKPRLVVFRAPPLEQPADLVQFADVGAAEAAASEHVHEGGGPPVIPGKIHEILGGLGHAGLLRRKLHPARLAWNCRAAIADLASTGGLGP